MGGSEILMASQHGNKHGTLAIEPVSTRQGDMIQMVERYSSIIVSFIRQLSFALYIIFAHQKIQALFSISFLLLILFWMRSSRLWARSSRLWMRSSRVWMRPSRLWMRSSRVWMRSSRVVRAADCQWERVLGTIQASCDTVDLRGGR
jgi:hypothetical protein